MFFHDNRKGKIDLKALSIIQPFAWLIVNGYKDIENRSWRTTQRGMILIHASKKVDWEGFEWVKQKFPNIPMPQTFKRGGIVGMANLFDCVSESQNPWFIGNYGFIFNRAKPLEFLKMKGQLGFFEALYPGIITKKGP